MKANPATPLRHQVLALALTLSAALTLGTSTTTAQGLRTWTQAGTGRTVEAEFVKLEDDKITIRYKSGGTRDIPLDMFSDADQAYAREQAALMTSEKRGDAAAPEEVILWDIHMGCDGCIDAISKAIKKAGKVSARPDRVSSSLTIRGNGKASLQKALDELAAAGFYGDATSNFEDLIIGIPEGADKEVTSATFTGLHLCCADCVKKFEGALGEAPGISDYEGVKIDSNSFTATGSFKPADVLEALHAVGMHATYKK